MGSQRQPGAPFDKLRRDKSGFFIKMGLTKAEYAAIQEKIAAELQSAAEYKRMADEQAIANRLTRLHDRLLNETVARYAHLAEEVDQSLRERAAQQSIRREFNDELSQRIEDLEQGIYALLTRDLAEMRRSRGRIGGRIDRRGELATLYRNLEKLRNQAAKHGLDVPLSVQNAIEETERKIEEIKGQ
jgi:hypothetical protein